MWLPRSSKGIDRLFHAFGIAYTNQHPLLFSNDDFTDEGAAILQFSAA